MKPRFLTMFLLIFTAAAAFGQQGSSTITGTVTDPSGANVAGAVVVATSTETGATRSATSQASGAFRLDALRPGNYILKVEFTGFKTLEMKDINLFSSETRDVGKLVLQIGQLNQMVEVTAQVTPVQTASSERAELVSSDQLERLTVKGRDPYAILNQVPGVISTRNSQSDLVDSGSMDQISINGNGYRTVQSNVDGVNTNHLACNCVSFVIPNIDAISEVRVLTNGNQAEYGRGAGGIINFVTKSGTSQFHGSAHMEKRHENLNANSFMNNRSNIVRPIYRYVTLGGSIGGPAYIPRLMPSSWKNKFFFFYSPEWSKAKQPTTSTKVNAPTALELAGDFSQTFYATSGAPKTPILLPITDPLTGKQFPGNVIPQSRFDPTGTGLGLMKFLAKPNGYVDPITPYSSNSLFYMTPNFLRADQVIRVDANLSEKLSVYYRYVRDWNELDYVNYPTQGIGRFTKTDPGRTHQWHATYVISPTLVNEAQFSTAKTQNVNTPNKDLPDSTWFRTSALDPPRLSGPLPPNQDFHGVPLYPGFLPSASFSGGNRGGFASLTLSNQSSGMTYGNGNRQFIWRDDVSKMWGSHSLKAGIYGEWSGDYDMLGTTYNGSFNFGSTANNPFDTGNGYANALLGVFQNYTEYDKRTLQDRHYKVVEFYIQDNWRVSRRFTLDFGVRFLHNGPTQDLTQYSTWFEPSNWNPASAPRLYWPACKVAGATCSSANQYALDRVTGATNFSNYIANLVPGVGNKINGVKWPVPSGITYAPLYAAPRFGFAWNTFGNDKTVLRGSFGVFHQRPNLNNLIGQNLPPVSYNPSVVYNYVSNLPELGKTALVSPTAGAVRSDQPLQTIYQVNLTVEQDIGFKMVANAAYVGNFDRHSSQTLQLNNVQFGAFALTDNIFNRSPISANLLRQPYNGMGAISIMTNSANAVNYHALQTSLRRRLSRGLAANVSYTFSKALGFTSWDAYHTGKPIQTAYGGTVTFPSLRDWYYGPTSQDRTHYFTASFSYDLPKINMPTGGAWKVLNLIGNSWTLSGITNATNGSPTAPSCSRSGVSFPDNDPTWTGAGGVRCQVVGDWKSFQKSFETNFNTAAFAYPSAGTAAAPTPTFGNAGINFMRNPGWWNQDLTMTKRFPLPGEGRSLSMQIQAYNVINHTEFTGINTSYSFNASGANTNATTGYISGTGSPRNVVISARFSF